MKIKFEKKYPDLSIEKEFSFETKFVAGIDEAGRGCLAGPVYSAAVILKNNELIDLGINDSKQLSAKKRELFFDKIVKASYEFSFHSIDNEEIDAINILKATHKAMHECVIKLNTEPDMLLIDGNSYSYSDKLYRTIIDGDAKCLSIACASIIAKVLRDKWMTEVADVEYPEYHFFKNKGYGSAEHIEAIKKFGICKYHRKTFLGKYLNSEIRLF